jgi:hypothetical protein
VAQAGITFGSFHPLDREAPVFEQGRPFAQQSLKRGKSTFTTTVVSADELGPIASLKASYSYLWGAK